MGDSDSSTSLSEEKRRRKGKDLNQEEANEALNRPMANSETIKNLSEEINLGMNGWPMPTEHLNEEIQSGLAGKEDCHMETFPQARSAPIADFSGFKEETIDLFDEPIRVDESHSSSSEGRNLEMDIVSTMPSTDIFQSPVDQEAFGGCRWPIIINVASACSTSNDSLNPNEAHNEHQDLSLNNVHNEHEHLLHQDNRHILDQDGHYEFQDILHPEEHRPINIEDDIALSGDAIDEASQATAFIVSQPSSTPRDPLASHLPQFNWLEHPSKQYWKKSPISSLEIFHNSSINAAYNEQFAESDNAEVDVDDTIVSVEQTRSIKYPQIGLEFDDDDAVETVRNQYEYAKKSKKLCGRPSFNPSKTETGTHKQLFEMNNTMFNAMLSNCHGGGFDVATVTSIIDYALKLRDVQKYFTTLREPIHANEKKVRKERNRVRCHLEELENELQDAKAKTAEHDAQASMFTTDSLYSMVSNCGGKGYDASTVTNIIKYALKLADVQKIFASSRENILTNEKNIRKERNRVRRNLEELENELQIAKAKTADHDAQALVYTTDSFNSNIERYFNTSGECLIPLPVISHQQLIKNILTKEAALVYSTDSFNSNIERYFSTSGECLIPLPVIPNKQSMENIPSNAAGFSTSTRLNTRKSKGRTRVDLSTVPAPEQSVVDNTAQGLAQESKHCQEPPDHAVDEKIKNANSPQNPSITVSTKSLNNKNMNPRLKHQPNFVKSLSKAQRNRERSIFMRKYHENRKALKEQRRLHQSIIKRKYHENRRAQSELEVQPSVSTSFVSLTDASDAVELTTKKRGRPRVVQATKLDEKFKFKIKEEPPEARHSVTASSASSINADEISSKSKRALSNTPAAIYLREYRARKMAMEGQVSISDSFAPEGEDVKFAPKIESVSGANQRQSRKALEYKRSPSGHSVNANEATKSIKQRKKETQHSRSCSVESSVSAADVESVIKKKRKRKLSTNPFAVYQRELYYKRKAVQKALQEQREPESQKKKRGRKRSTRPNLSANKEKDQTTLEDQCSNSESLASSVNGDSDTEFVRTRKKRQNLLNTPLAIYQRKRYAMRKRAQIAAAVEKQKLCQKFNQHKRMAKIRAQKALKEKNDNSDSVESSYINIETDSELEKKRKKAMYARMWYQRKRSREAQEAQRSTNTFKKSSINEPKFCTVKLENCLFKSREE